MRVAAGQELEEAPATYFAFVNLSFTSLVYVSDYVRSLPAFVVFMRHSVSIRDEVGQAVEAVADEEGLSISEFYARAAEAYLKRIRRRRAIEKLDRKAGAINLHGDLDEALSDIRRDDPERP